MHPVERIPTLAEILPSFVERAHSMIWANLTTRLWQRQDA